MWLTLTREAMTARTALLLPRLILVGV